MILFWLILIPFLGGMLCWHTTLVMDTNDKSGTYKIKYSNESVG